MKFRAIGAVSIHLSSNGLLCAISESWTKDCDLLQQMPADEKFE
jgi:hypothetical protein